ncbi:uncharacterized protein LOC133264116 [Pezoporus flaviventris]|uniref:uncharacterized protein LOC133264116 n=1 Tax=Pezoporus flaviventris TaxID=889875 RepID=UPI002AB21591|nr:uncharacterized protein LOC133264116 [Pezoporus flaviventris]
MAAPRCPLPPLPRGRSQDPGPPLTPRRLQRDPAAALRGGLGRLQLRAEEAARVSALYRRLAAHLQAEARAQRGRLQALEAELRERRRRLRDLREGQVGAMGHNGGLWGAVGGLRLRELEEEAEQDPQMPQLLPPCESPELDPEPEGAPPECTSEAPPPTLAPPPASPRPRPRDLPGSIRTERSLRPSLLPPLGALSAAQDRALRELRSEVAALEQRLQELRHRGGDRRGSRRGAEPLQRRLREAERGRDRARRDLEELNRTLESGAVGLGLLLERLGLDEGRPLAVPQLLALVRAGIEALREGGRGQRRAPPPPSAPPQLQCEDPDTEDPTELPHSSDEDGAAPPAAPPSRAAIKTQSRLLLEGHRGGPH